MSDNINQHPRLLFSTTITIPFGKLGKVLRWCDTNCAGEWKYYDNPDSWFERSSSAFGSPSVLPTGSQEYRYQFLFENDKDLLAFTMVHR